MAKVPKRKGKVKMSIKDYLDTPDFRIHTGDFLEYDEGTPDFETAEFQFGDLFYLAECEGGFRVFSVKSDYDAYIAQA